MFGFDVKAMVVAAGASAMLAATAYVLWGPSQKPRTKYKKGLVPGLVNLGNSCFLNALLQSLAPCLSLREWLQHLKSCEHNVSTHVSSVLRHVLTVLNNGSLEYTTEYCPSDVIDALRTRNWIISPGEQDCHELFHVLTETLDEESMKYPNVISLFDVNALQAHSKHSVQAAQQRVGTICPKLPQKEHEYPFRGLLSTQLQCRICGHKNPIRYDLFDSLSLTIPATYMGSLSVESLLRHYIVSESVNDVDCDGCSRLAGDKSGTVKSPFIKKTTIGKLPRCLCIHIQRTYWLDNGMPVKRFEHVNFPEVLNMEPFVYHSKPRRPAGLSTLSGITETNGLMGGRKRATPKTSPLPSPVLSAPYSLPVRLLKAANHHQRATLPGLPTLDPAQSMADPNSNKSHAASQALGNLTSPTDDSRVKQLAAFYSQEHRNTSNHCYRLVSNIVHLGDVHTGHFVAYRRATPKVDVTGMHMSAQWLYASDSHVRKATSDEVFTSTAYMLFYEKI